MGIWGKIIGGVAGLAMGGPLGALMGATAGHAVDRMRAEAARGGFGTRSHGYTHGPASEHARNVAFTVAVVALSAKMAKVDGHVSREEIDAFKTLFRIPPEEMAVVGRMFDQAKTSADGFEDYAIEIADLFADSPEVLEELLDSLFFIAMADGGLNEAERTFLETVAAIFGLSDRDFNRVHASHDKHESDAYAILGVSRSDSNEVIKAAYRKLIRENHPDTLIAKGMPQEFVTVATGKMAVINAAYDRVAEERGLR
ncbi:MAG: TerB family tellurite resistance protein [Alphaproteobacteria bacterium]|nr:TerB family tellurite resistance protein [Alphaproteobacteria bacterium]